MRIILKDLTYVTREVGTYSLPDYRTRHGKRQLRKNWHHPLVGGGGVPEAVLEPPRRRTRSTPVSPACQTSQRQRAAGRRNSPLPAPATAEGATFRTIPCRGTGTVATTPRRCASVDGGLGPPYVLASLSRLPRSRLVLLLLRARISGGGGRRLTTARSRPLASGQRRALLRSSLLQPPRARTRDEHGTARCTVLTLTTTERCTLLR